MNKKISSDSPLDITQNAEKALQESVVPQEKKVDKRPSILYCCAGNILDITSGAALSLRTILASFARRGFRATAIQATIFDSPQGGQHVMAAGKDQKEKAIWRTVISDVEHLIVKTGVYRRHLMTVQEEETLVQLFRNELNFRKPDFVFLWGSLILERTIMREARDANVPVVFYLVNPGYKDITVFKDVSIVISDTHATAKLYKERLGLDCKVVGKFISTEELKSTVPRKPDFFTFINPSFEKGVSVFMPLAKLLAKEAPEIKFLVVQSRGVWANALNVLKFKPEDFPNVTVIGHQHNMKPIYASTRTLILPSLWHESGARVIAEAQINGIPILASNTGGSAELIGKGGMTFDLAEDVREKKGEVLIKEEDLRPWVDEIKRHFNDQAYYKKLCEFVDIESKQHDIDNNTTRFIAAVSEEVRKSQVRRLQEFKNKTSDSKHVKLINEVLKKKQAKLQPKKRKK